MKNLIMLALISSVTLSNMAHAQPPIGSIFVGGHDCDEIAICYLGTHEDPHFQYIGTSTQGLPCPAATPNFALRKLVAGDPDCITVNSMCAHSNDPVDPPPAESL